MPDSGSLANPSLEELRDACVAALTDSLEAFTSYPELTKALRDTPSLRPASASLPYLPYVVAIGKASLSLCAAAASGLPQIRRGVAVVPHGYTSSWTVDVPWGGRLDVLESAHPVSDASSCAASFAVEDLLSGLSSRDAVVVLISGGGSSLVGCPIDGLPAAEYRKFLERLYRSGAPIAEVNAIRRGLSRLAGGGLLASAARARVYAFVLSDVPGDATSTVASGPCSALSDDDIKITEAAISERFGSGLATLAAERLRANAGAGQSLERLALVGSNFKLLENVSDRLRDRGIRVVARRELTGEASECGKAEANFAAKTLKPGEAILLGGECTVTVTGSGRGGRSQEFVLSGAKTLQAAGCVAIVGSIGSDGYDGPTDAAGAALIADMDHLKAVSDLIDDALEQNDAYPLLERAGGLIFTGPTHTNVMDVAFIARPPDS